MAAESQRLRGCFSPPLALTLALAGAGELLARLVQPRPWVPVTAPGRPWLHQCQVSSASMRGLLTKPWVPVPQVLTPWKLLEGDRGARSEASCCWDADPPAEPPGNRPLSAGGRGHCAHFLSQFSGWRHTQPSGDKGLGRWAGEHCGRLGTSRPPCGRHRHRWGCRARLLEREGGQRQDGLSPLEKDKEPTGRSSKGCSVLSNKEK